MQQSKNFLSIGIYFLLYFIPTVLFFVLLGKMVFWFNTPAKLLAVYGVSVTSVLLIIFLTVFFFYKDPYKIVLKKVLTNNHKRYFVSCLVAVHNEKDIIDRCVQSLLNQTYEYREIIIVNDASTDQTGKILDKYEKEGLVKIIHLKENLGKKKALGQAMLQAKGEIFAFTDSDSVLAEDAIEKVVKILQFNPLIGAVSGHCRALNGNKNLLTKIQDSWYEGQFSIRKAFESVFGAVTCVSGPLAVFRKEAIYNFIPAWENDTFLGEEFRFATDRTLTGFVLGSKSIGEKLKRRYKDSPFVKEIDYPTRDWKVVYSKSAKAWTNVPDSFSKVIKQQIRWKKSFIRNIFFTGKFYYKKAFLAALFYYLHIFYVLVGPVIAFRHIIYAPLHGDWLAAIYYVVGISLVGFLFGLAYKYENKDSSGWIYRPLMSLLSTLVVSWLIFYSVITIKRNVWSRG